MEPWEEWGVPAGALASRASSEFTRQLSAFRAARHCCSWACRPSGGSEAPGGGDMVIGRAARRYSAGTMFCTCGALHKQACRGQ